MINRLPLTVGFARVSQATEDQGNLETQTQQLQDYGVHELVTETGSGARSDRRDLQARLHAGDTLVVTAIDSVDHTGNHVSATSSTQAPSSVSTPRPSPDSSSVRNTLPPLPYLTDCSFGDNRAMDSRSWLFSILLTEIFSLRPRSL